MGPLSFVGECDRTATIGERWRSRELTCCTWRVSRGSRFRWGRSLPPWGGSWFRGRRGMIDTLRLTAEEAMGLLERREVSSAELFDAYRDAIAARDGELNCFLTTVDDPTHAGVPIALKDVIGTQGVRTTAGSRFLE